MKIGLGSTLLISLLSLAASSHASVIHLDSAPGLFNSISGATVAITPHSLWQQNNPVNPGDSSDTSAVWISYALTGYGDSYYQPPAGTDPAVSVFQNFTSGAGLLNLKVWADDTAEVLLDGISIFSPKFTQGVCSGQPIGCQPGDAGVINSVLTAGAHQLEFRVFQVGTGGDTSSNPFGLLYTGTAPERADASAPEPGTIGLAGLVLLAALPLKKRLLQKRSEPLLAIRS
jgi:hypothetical protein